MKNQKEICVECGRNTRPGSGLFVNRVPVLDSPKENKEMGRHFPKGTYECRDCEAISDMFFRLNNPDEKNMKSVVRKIKAEIRGFDKTEYVKELMEEIKYWRSK